MKRIAILLACVMLAGCTAMPTGTVSTESVSSLAAVSSANVSSENVRSAEADSKTTESVDASSVAASQSAAIDTETSARQKAFRKIKKAIKEYEHASGYTLKDSTFEQTETPNDPCVLEMDTFDHKYMVTFEKQGVDPLPRKEQKQIYTAVRRCFLEMLASDGDPATATTPCYYYGKVDAYAIVYIFWSPTGDNRMRSYNRIAGYQFPCAELSQRHTQLSFDKHYNLKKSCSIKDALMYSGIFLVKNDKAATLEDLYLDGKINATFVGKVYAALPRFLQCGEFEHYTEAFGLVGKNTVLQKDGREVDVGAYYMTYHDRDGKFHVVVA